MPWRPGNLGAATAACSPSQDGTLRSKFVGFHGVQNTACFFLGAVCNPWHALHPKAAHGRWGRHQGPRPMMYVALTYDHRLIDGREAVLFLRNVKDIVEDPRRLLLDV